MQINKPGMAWIGKVLDTSPIDGADMIQRADVICGAGGRWAGVVKKGLPIGESVVVFLPDSIVPSHPALDFMEKHGRRVKMMRLRGSPSEVLIVPAKDIGVAGDLGQDVTDLLGVLKHEKEIPAAIAGDIAGAFPSFIRKTDEVNFQTAPHLREAIVGQPCYVSTKYDGTSQTFFHRDGVLGGCSRNWQLKESDKTAVWQIAARFNLADKLPGYGNIALQWECVGPGIQGNPLKLKTAEPRLFDVFLIDQQEYMSFAAMSMFSREINMPLVETMLLHGKAWSDDELRDMARGMYSESGNVREGIVIRSCIPSRVGGDRLSFKVINLDYKERS